ncbi:MAG: PH domain-containing protein [Deltaproteobacteria bacterium]|nr:PH domain-containing protein [Deltaproteobacteria bacterium]
MQEYTPLDQRARLLFYLQAISRLMFLWLPMVAIMAGVLVALVSVVGGLVAGAVLSFLLFLAAVWFPSLAFDRWGYMVRADEVLITHGVLVRRVTAIPVSRIQHVDTRQGLIEQWIGLARVKVFTASGIGGDGVIPGLALEDAEDLRDRLVSLGGGDDGV